MKIHKVELQRVRQIKDVSLNLSAPLTVIAGPLGVGKTTIQKAILGAMFLTKKEERISLVSRYDPNSPPVAVLHLSRGNDAAPSIRLSRKLIDDSGEWKEGATTLSSKGKALEQIQESLPISSTAAATLLWGLQDDMVTVLDEFPSDGHSMLTAATIRGTGPDPREVTDALEEEFSNTKKTGQNPGSLTRTQLRVSNVEKEFQMALAAQDRLATLTKEFERAKSSREQAQRQRELSEKEVKRLAELERLLDSSVKFSEKLSRLEAQRKELDGLEDEIKKVEREVKSLQDEVITLKAQYRVAKNKELSDKIQKLELQIGVANEAENKYAELKKELNAKIRPEKSDEKDLIALKGRVKEARDRMNASGVRYNISVESGTKILELSEDLAATQRVQLSASKPLEGVAGNIVVVSDNLRMSASGKEDVATLKRFIENAHQDINKILEKYGVQKEDAFYKLLQEKNSLDEDLKKIEREMEKELKGSTLNSLKTELELARAAHKDIKVTLQDKEEWSNRSLNSANEIEKNLVRKEAQVSSKEEEVKKLLLKQPDDKEKSSFSSALASARKEAASALNAFKDVDESRRDATSDLLEEIKRNLDKTRGELLTLMDQESAANVGVTKILTELKHAGPERPISNIEADLEEAKSVLHREQTLQSARRLLIEQINQKVVEMAEDVPKELGDRISAHLSAITRGAYGKVSLSDNFAVSSIGEGGKNSDQWKPNELSWGERHVAALAIKIAVARALAESKGSVFIVLDDSLVHFDPEHREATEDLLLNLVKDGRLQVILLTCHSDWAFDWKKRAGEFINYIELTKVAQYYRPPAAMNLVRNSS